MTETTTFRWPLIVGLGAIALVRPLARIVEASLGGTTESPVLAWGLTIAITVVWVAIVGFGRVARPVLTLVFAGLVYAVLSILASGIISPILTGELQGPLVMPIAIIPVLLTNAAWGAIAGLLALLVQRLRASRVPAHPAD